MKTSWDESELQDHYDRLKVSPQAETIALLDLQKPKRSKFNVDRSAVGKAARTVDGRLFDSKREAEIYVQLRTARDAGVISDLVLQPSFELLADFVDSSGRKVKGVTYTPDFQYNEEDRIMIVEVKGHKTKDYVIRSKWFRWKFPQYTFDEM